MIICIAKQSGGNSVGHQRLSQTIPKAFIAWLQVLSLLVIATCLSLVGCEAQVGVNFCFNLSNKIPPGSMLLKVTLPLFNKRF